jgi:hypothetical protein
MDVELYELEIQQFWEEMVLSDPMLHAVRAFLMISVRSRIFDRNLHVFDSLRTKIRARLKNSNERLNSATDS